ncbi:MAG: MATE family efflux transporter [bacterium]
MSRNRAILTSGPVGKTLILLAAPMMIGIFSSTIFNITDTYFVAKLGTRELAAMNFTFPVVMVLGGLSMGMGLGAGSALSRAIGSGDEKAVKRLATDALLLALLIVIIISLIGLATINSLFRLLGATDETLPLIKTYMSIWYLGTAFMVIPMVGNHCIRATGNTAYPSIVMMTSAIINVILDPVLIFGLLGIPRLELTGAAIATVIARSMTCIAALWFLNYKVKILDFSLPKFKDVIDSWKQIIYIAMPATLSRMLIPLSMGIVTRLAAELGTTSVAAFGSGVKISGIVLVPLRALSMSMIPYIGQNWGAKQFDRVQEGRIIATRFSLIWGALLVVWMLFFGSAIARQFSSEPEVIVGITLFLWIDPIGYGLRGVFIISNGIMNAINKPMVPAVLMILRLAILYVPLAYLGMKLWHLPGMFAGMALANSLSGIVAWIFAKIVTKSEEAKILTIK